MRIASILILFVTSALSQPLSALERSDIDLKHLSLEFKISLDGESISQNSLEGIATMRFQNTGDEDIKNLPLLLNRLMRFSSVRDEQDRELELQTQLLELDNFEFFQANAGIVTLLQPLQPGDSTQLSVSFTGRLTGYADAGMSYTREVLDPEFTIIRSEVLPWPHIAEPDWLEVRSSWADTFDWVVAFDVPGTHVVANGQPVEVMDNGDRHVFTYRSAEPNTYMVFPIAPYKTIEVGDNRIYFLPGSDAGAGFIATQMTQAMALYERWFGSLVKGENGLSIIEIPEGYGSQAKVPTIIQTADAFNSKEEIDQLYHELSHLWNVEKYEPQNPRLEEGLATFLQSLVDEKLSSEDSLKEVMAARSKRMAGIYERNPEFRNIAIADFGSEGVTGLSYGVGALFYYELYLSLGEKKFFDLINGYYKEYAGGMGSFDNMVSYYRKSLPNESINLLDQWLTGTGYVEKLGVN
jgi:aminopeptidase N